MRSGGTLARDRFRGALLGLATGDALGTTVEFKSPGSFEPVTDMVGGGYFHLEPGQWTDDTSLALCLAESLITSDGFDPSDQARRYVSWYLDGHLSSTGRCFDIGHTTLKALESFRKTDRPEGPKGEWEAGNGSIMRLVPVVMYYANDIAEASEMAGRSSRVTHSAPQAVDACRYFGALLAGALQGKDKSEILAPTFYQASLHPEVQAVASGSFHEKEPPEIRGAGYVVQSLEAALWAFAKSRTFVEGVLLAVNLGDDADTTGAVYGQIAGAYYAEASIPLEWRQKLTMRGLIQNYADQLWEKQQSRAKETKRWHGRRIYDYYTGEYLGRAVGEPYDDGVVGLVNLRQDEDGQTVRRFAICGHVVLDQPS